MGKRARRHPHPYIRVEKLNRARPLNGDHVCVVGAVIDDHTLWRVTTHPLDIGGTVGGVDHYPPATGESVYEKVVQYQAFFVKEEGIAGVTIRHVQDAGAHEARYKGVSTRAAHLDLAHVIYVEEPDGSPAGQMLLYCASRIGDRHVVTSERCHLGSIRKMPVVQSGGQQEEPPQFERKSRRIDHM